MDDLAFKEWLREEALALGFARVGFASCEPSRRNGTSPRLVFKGGAKHLPTSMRRFCWTPAVLEGAKTALVGFFPYARPDAIPGSSPGSLKLSRYLWGRTTHSSETAFAETTDEGAGAKAGVRVACAWTRHR